MGARTTSGFPSVKLRDNPPALGLAREFLQLLFLGPYMGVCYGLTCVPQNSDVEALTPNVAVFEGRPFKR